MNDFKQLRPLFKMFLKTNKPWSKKTYSELSQHYDNGWNDCLKELQKNADKWFVHMDKGFQDLKTKNENPNP